MRSFYKNVGTEHVFAISKKTCYTLIYGIDTHWVCDIMTGKACRHKNIEIEIEIESELDLEVEQDIEI